MSHQETLFLNTVGFSLLDDLTVRARRLLMFATTLPAKNCSGARTSRRFQIVCSADFCREISESAASLVSIGCILIFHLRIGQPS
jgi:hypothetical protein